MAILKNFVLVLLMGIFLLDFVFAIADVDIAVDDTFSEGDEIKFGYRFMSSQDEVIKYAVSVNCPGSLESLLELKEAILVANEHYQESYFYGIVDENVKPGECLASVSILEPYVLEFNKKFNIINSLDISFDLNVCEDFYCSIKSKVFAQGEKIYLNSLSSVPSVSVIATLVYPNKSSEHIDLPHSIKASQIGTYDLNVAVSKQGYKTINKKVQFGVIEKEAEISQTYVCDINGFCEGEENSHNCPQDCLSESVYEGVGEISNKTIGKEPFNDKLFLFLLIAVVLIVITLIRIIKFKSL